MTKINILIISVFLFIIYSCSNSQDNLIAALGEADLEGVSSALEKGADMHLPNESGFSPLELAAQRGDANLISEMLRFAVLNEEPLNLQDFQDAYEITLEKQHWDSASHFIWEISESQGVEGQVLWVNYPNQGVPVYGGPNENLEFLGNFDHGEELTLNRRTMLNSYVQGDDGLWISVSGLVEGRLLNGWVMDTYLVDQQPRAASIMEERVVDSTGGLNMRGQPSLDGEPIFLLPGGATVMLIREEGETLTIGGRTGKWSFVEWQGSTRGWVFGGFLKEIRPIHVNLNIAYKASFLEGIPNTDAGTFWDQELYFLDGNRVDYRRMEYYFDGQVVQNHSGSYSIEGNRVIIELELGKESVETYEDFGGGDDSGEGGMSYVEGFTMVLLRLDDPALNRDFDFFIEESHWQSIESENYSADHSSFQYVLEEEGRISKIGYFYQSGK